MGFIQNLIRNAEKKYVVGDLKVFVRAFNEDAPIDILKGSLQDKDYTLIGYFNDEETKFRDILTGVVYNYDKKTKTCRIQGEVCTAVEIVDYLSKAKIVQNTNDTIRLIDDIIYSKTVLGVTSYYGSRSLRRMFMHDENDLISLYGIKKSVKDINDLVAYNMRAEIKRREKENACDAIRERYNKNF